MGLLASLRINLLGDMADLSKKLDAASAKLEAFGKKTEQLGKSMSKTLTAPIVAFGGASVRAFGIQEDAERKLAAAIRATGGEVDKNLDRFKSFASEMQRLTVVGDETTLRLLQVATSIGLSSDQAERAAQNAIAMAAAYDVSAESAIRMTSALERGDTTMLNRYFKELQNIEDATERAEAAQRLLSNAFEVAKAEALTFTGQLKQLKNDFGDFMEAVGEVVSEAITPFINRIKEVMTVLQGLDKETLAVYVRYAALAASAGPILMAVGAFAKLTLGIKALTVAMLANPYTALGAGILALGGYLAYTAAKSRLLTHAFHQQMAAQTEVNGTAEDTIRLARLIADANQVLANQDLSGEQRKFWEARVASLREALALNEKLMSEATQTGQPQSATVTIPELIPPQRPFADFIVPIDQIAEIERRFDAIRGNIDDLLDFEYNAPELMFPPGSLGHIQDELKAVRVALLGATDPEHIATYTARIAELTEQMNTFGIEVQNVSPAMVFLGSVADRFVNSFGEGMANVIVQGEKLTDTLKNIGKLLASAAIQKGLQMLLAGSTGGASMLASGGGGGLLGGLLGGLFGRASGGRVTGGSPYMVGERGPELFVPGSTGGIISNGGLAGSGSVNVTGMFRISGSDLVAVVDNSRRTYR